MTTSRPRNRRYDDDSAVSSVLGAILVFGLLVLTLLSVQVNFVPVWDKQRENNFSLEIGTQLNTVRADLDRLVANATNGPFSDPLTLTRQTGFSFFTAGVQPATVTFTPSSAAAGMTITTARPITILSSGGHSLTGLAEDYTSLPSGTTLPNVVAIDTLRLRIGAAGNPATGTPPAGQTGLLTLLVNDVNGKCAGRLLLSETGLSGADHNVDVQVFAADNPPTATCTALINNRDDPVKCIGAACVNSPVSYFLDALDPTLLFSSVLAAASPPFQVTLTASNLIGAGAITYDTSTSGGNIHVGGAGQTLSSYTNFVSSGTLTVHAPYQKLPQQDTAFEYGAVLVTQPGQGSAMVVPPQFSVGTSATQAALSWSFAAMGGGSAAVNGARQAYVGLTGSSAGFDVQAAASDITFTVSTAHPDVWASYWDQQMQLAGLTSAASFTPVAPCVTTASSPQYTLTQTATSATLAFFGPCSAPSDPLKDIFLNLKEGGVTVALQPSG
jgi:hypothetical protein